MPVPVQPAATAVTAGKGGAGHRRAARKAKMGSFLENGKTGPAGPEK